jgi:hypothetical protein
MPDTELSALTEDTAPPTTYWVYMVDSGGTIDRKVTYANVRRSPATRLFLNANYR